eukprot:227528-Rhodomonas_salina.1
MCFLLSRVRSHAPVSAGRAQYWDFESGIGAKERDAIYSKLRVQVRKVKDELKSAVPGPMRMRFEECEEEAALGVGMWCWGCREEGRGG